MAVAVKNAPETRTSSAVPNVQLVSVIGAVYLVASLAVIFKAIPELLRLLIGNTESFGGVSLLVLVMLAGAAGLIYVGGKLLGPKQLPGTRAGIFVCLLFLLIALLLTRWVSLWLEYWVYFHYLFTDSGKIVGIVLTALAGVGFLVLFGRWFFRRSFAQTLARIEGQGWFSAHAYKPHQGQKVRRGTILGLLVLIAAGIWTLHSHKTLEHGLPNWEIGIPFTGTMVDIQPNDAKDEIVKQYNDTWQKNGIPAYAYRTIRDHYDPANYVRIDTITDIGDFKRGQVLRRTDFFEERKKLPEIDKEKLLDKDEVQKLKEENPSQSVPRPGVVPADPPRAHGVGDDHTAAAHSIHCPVAPAGRGVVVCLADRQSAGLRRLSHRH